MPRAQPTCEEKPKQETAGADPRVRERPWGGSAGLEASLPGGREPLSPSHSQLCSLSSFSKDTGELPCAAFAGQRWKGPSTLPPGNKPCPRARCLGDLGTGQPARSSALLLPQPCSTWLPYDVLLNPAAAWPQAAVQALCSGYQLAAERRADKGQFRARRSLRASAPSTRLCGERGQARQMLSTLEALSFEGQRESGQSGALPALQGVGKKGFRKDCILLPQHPPCPGRRIPTQEKKPSTHVSGLKAWLQRAF